MDTQTAEGRKIPSINDTPKVGAWKGGFLLARASWSTLKLDKELIAFPVLSAIVGALIAGTFIGILWITGLVPIDQFYAASGTYEPGSVQIISLVIYGFLMTVLSVAVNNYFGAALIACALHRFRGNDPTVGYGLEKANKRFGSLLGFSLISGTIGYIVKALQKNDSIVSNIIGTIIGVAWAVASLFAVPVIVDSEKPVGPIEAIKGSANVLKKAWAQNVVGGLGMGVVFFLLFFAWLLVAVILNGLAFYTSPYILIGTIPVSIILLIVLNVVTSTLNSVFQAALYYYATSGDSPVNFDKGLLQAAFKPNPKHFI